MYFTNFFYRKIVKCTNYNNLAMPSLLHRWHLTNIKWLQDPLYSSAFNSSSQPNHWRERRHCLKLQENIFSPSRPNSGNHVRQPPVWWQLSTETWVLFSLPQQTLLPRSLPHKLGGATLSRSRPEGVWARPSVKWHLTSCSHRLPTSPNVLMASRAHRKLLRSLGVNSRHDTLPVSEYK